MQIIRLSSSLKVMTCYFQHLYICFFPCSALTDLIGCFAVTLFLQQISFLEGLQPLPSVEHKMFIFFKGLGKGKKVVGRSRAFRWAPWTVLLSVLCLPVVPGTSY